MFRMKKLYVRFEKDETRKDIEIVIKADKEDAQVKKIIESLTRREPEKLTLLDKDGHSCIVDEEDIILVSSDGKSVNITTKKGLYRAKLSLQSIEDMLGKNFLRVSRFELVNLKMVSKYDFTIGGTLRIEFNNGMETWASRRYIPLIKERLSGEEGYLC